MRWLQHVSKHYRKANAIHVQRFRDDRHGGVAIIFALTVIMIVGIVGGAIDYGRWHHAKTKLQYAIDNAALAAGRVAQTSGGDTDQVVATARTYYDQMKSNDLITETATFEPVDNGTAIRATSDAEVSTPFLSVYGFPKLPIHVGAKVILSNAQTGGHRVEISMMLDVTGSMWGTKLADLKTAAKDLVNIVVDSNNPDYARVALAPFSEHVNVGPDYYEAVTGQPPESNSTETTCVRERTTIRPLHRC